MMESTIPTQNMLVVACGALARELRHLPDGLPISIEYLPAHLHNRPEKIVPALDELVSSQPTPPSSILVGYADCGTAGALDRWCADNDASRLPGAHCYETFAGTDRYNELVDEQPGTFFLTDYLARHFEALVMDGLGITAHPELIDAYFGNYTRLALISQSDDHVVLGAARRAAAMLNLDFEHHPVGRHRLLSHVEQAVTIGVRSTELAPGAPGMGSDVASDVESVADAGSASASGAAAVRSASDAADVASADDQPPVTTRPSGRAA